MKNIKFILLILGFILPFKNHAFSQTEEQPEKVLYSKIYCGISFDFGILTGMEKNIYQPIHQGLPILDGKSSIALHFERTYNKRLASIIGINLSELSHAFDGEPEIDNINNKLIIKQAGENKRYPEFHQFNLNVPVQLRFYFSDNYKEKKNIYLQGGARVGYSYLSRYRYRENNEWLSVPFNDINGFTYGPELVFGHKSGKDFFERRADDISFSVYYQMSSFTQNGVSSNLRPLVGSIRWGF